MSKVPLYMSVEYSGTSNKGQPPYKEHSTKHQILHKFPAVPKPLRG